MARVDILSGVYTNSDSDFRISYPKNLVPIPMINGISKGYLRPAEGIIQEATGPGMDRGGINWEGVHYRVMGTKLVSIDSNGTITTLGDVGSGGTCTLDYSFDRLAIASGGRLYYYKSGVLTQVTDPDLGTCLDVRWVDGYFMSTDGTSLVVTELTDPFDVNPVKYGSSEADPDPIVGILKLRNEIYALNRHTVEVFQNVGGDLFPFARVEGAQVQRGSIGTHSCAVFLDGIVFLGGARNEPPAIWLAANGASTNISSREIDQILHQYTEDELALVVMETRVAEARKLLYVHLPDRTLIYDGASSSLLQQPVWSILTSSDSGMSQYRAKNFVWVYNRWFAGDPTSSSIGYLTDEISTHYEQTIDWEFGTSIIYNDGKGAIFNEMELVCLTGRVALGVTPTVWTSYSTDGLTWSQEKYRTIGKIGETLKRIVWYQQGFMRSWRIQKFRGNSDSLLSITALLIAAEPLNV